ncbi:unnamed protein product, partial [marine sediment metagenome]
GPLKIILNVLSILSFNSSAEYFVLECIEIIKINNKRCFSEYRIGNSFKYNISEINLAITPSILAKLFSTTLSFP